MSIAPTRMIERSKRRHPAAEREACVVEVHENSPPTLFHSGETFPALFLSTGKCSVSVCCGRPGWCRVVVRHSIPTRGPWPGQRTRIHEYLDDFTPGAVEKLRPQTHPTKGGVIQGAHPPDSPGRVSVHDSKHEVRDTVKVRNADEDPVIRAEQPLT